ncbi:MAG: 50S ribosomal protein L22 [Helicobacter sp.]|nr:50S ribosomal protein L22 [Helicobacter sp.]
MSTALLRFVRLSPTKARLVAREIQGMNAEVALASLEFTPNKAAKLIAKVLASAVANGNHEASNVAVASCRIDTGPVLRRFTPRARGRATPIRKPTSHIFVEVAEMTDKKPKNSSRRGKKVAQSEDK